MDILSQPIISVIICTYNGSSRLPEVIETLKCQNFQGPLEIILVDNCSSDETALVVKTLFKQVPKHIQSKYVFEANPGLIHARHAGVKKSDGKYLVFCDDDNFLDKNYLQVVFDFFEKMPVAGILGGEAIAITEGVFPDWFESFQYAYACGKKARQTEDITGKRMLWGAGIAIRGNLAKIIFDDTHPFLLTGRKGKELISGEDDEICYRIMITGYHLYYHSALQLRHLIPASRLTIAYRDRLIDCFALQVDALGAYKRYYDLGQSHLSTPIAFIKKMVAFIYYKVLMLQRQEAHAADFLYYLTGWGFWRTPENETVLRFGSFVKSKKNI